MASKDFLDLLPEELKLWIRDEFKGLSPQKDALYNAAESVFGRENSEFFIELLENDNFKYFLKQRRTVSPMRIEGQFERLFDRVMMEIPIPTVAMTAAGMADPDYIKTERYFFSKKSDHSVLIEFERNFRRVMEQNSSLKHYFLKLAAERDFLDIMEMRDDVSFFLFEKITDYLLGTKNLNSVLQLCRDILQPSVLRFGKIAVSEGMWKAYYSGFIGMYARPNEVSSYIRSLDIYSARYKPGKLKSVSDKNMLAETEGLKPFFLLMKTDEHFTQWALFLKNFGNRKDSFELFVWTEVFNVPLLKILPAMEILNSSAFERLQGFYFKDPSVLRFLIRSIMTSLHELKMRNLNPSSYKFILKLFLNLKIDSEFLKRRAFFFHLLREYSSSRYMELEMIRYIFFEYIFIATKTVTDYKYGMTRFCDESHRVFCEWVDGSYLEAMRLDPKERVGFFKPVFDYFRAVIWIDHIKKFGKFKYRFEQFQSAVISANLEDAAVDELKKVETEEFPAYHESFFNVFYTKPERIYEAVSSDYWYRLSLDQARPHIQSILLNLIGTINLMPGQSGAYTDGSSVYLPEYQNSFKDPHDPIEENRNLTLYIGLALHECGHIIAGTFRFNLEYYLRTLEKPYLFKMIMNIFEDHRIEAFLVKMKIHAQSREILKNLNEFLSVRNWKNEMPVFMRFLLFCFDRANGYEEILKKFSDYEEKLNSILSLSVNTGRFPNLKSLMEYISERLKNMNIGNPMAAYELSREVYEIQKHWPMQEEDEEEQKPAKGMHRIMCGEGEESDAPPPQTVLNEEELRELYRQYNDNPRQFVEDYNLPYIPEIHSGGKETKDGSPSCEWITEEEPIANYDESGTIDFSHRTKADDLSAEEKLSQREEKKGRTVKKRKKKTGTKKVYSIDPKTKSRTRLTEIKEHTVTKTDMNFLKKIRRWDFVRHKIMEEISRLELRSKEDHDISAVEGEINMELLLEIISGKNKVGVFEFLDIYTETKKSLDVIIGIDASGSTASDASDGYSVIDVEKAFAIIFGEALAAFTDNVKCLAFDSMTSTTVYRAATLKNISSVQPGNGNRDGDFIRFVSDELKTGTSELKYFFFLSDGQPNSDNYSGKEAMDDTLIALREAKKSGIRIIYFNIDSEKREYFEQFAKETAFAQHFKNPTDLIPVIPELIRSMAKAVG